MKSLPLLLAAALSCPFAHATTIVGSGGTSGAQFVTSDGIFLTPTNSTVKVGVYDAINGFTQFAATDATPITFGSTAALTGRWLANVADTSADANFFNGKQIAVQVYFYYSGIGNAVGGSALYLSTSNFPTNGGGVGDSLNLSGSSLTTLVQSQSTPSSAAYQAPTVDYPTGYLVIGTIPEASTSLLAVLGAGALLRRRRRC